MPQDITAERSRQMRGGKRGPVSVSEHLTEEDLLFTYVPDGQDGAGLIQTITTIIRRSDGTSWQKVSTFTYGPPADTTAMMLSKTDSLTLLP